LPDINKIAINNQNFRVYRFEVLIQFFSLTANKAEVNIADNHHFYFSFRLGHGFPKMDDLMLLKGYSLKLFKRIRYRPATAGHQKKLRGCSTSL
jgi:hypothetical protein